MSQPILFCARIKSLPCGKTVHVLIIGRVPFQFQQKLGATVSYRGPQFAETAASFHFSICLRVYATHKGFGFVQRGRRDLKPALTAAPTFFKFTCLHSTFFIYIWADYIKILMHWIASVARLRQWFLQWLLQYCSYISDLLKAVKFW